MGLDMFLYRVPKISPEETAELETMLNRCSTVEMAGRLIDDFFREKTFIYTPSVTIFKHWEEDDGTPSYKFKIKPEYHNAAYWRKFNALHGWFVREVQGGVDDCGEYIITKDAVLNLVDILVKLVDVYLDPEITDEKINDLVQELFPPTAGFFFGQTIVDDYFWDCTQRTITICRYLLSEMNWDEEQLLYRSSW